MQKLICRKLELFDKIYICSLSSVRNPRIEIDTTAGIIFSKRSSRFADTIVESVSKMNGPISSVNISVIMYCLPVGIVAFRFAKDCSIAFSVMKECWLLLPFFELDRVSNRQVDRLNIAPSRPP